MRVRALGGVVSVVVALSAGARANGWSDFTVGVGTGIGVHEAGAPDSGTETALISQANVRFKFLTVLGLDYAVDLMRDRELTRPAADALNFRAKMRLTALIYPYNAEALSFYFGGGLGGAKIADLGRTDAPANSYHAGAGFEIHIADHMSLDASFMLVAPGSRSVENVAVARVEAALARGEGDAMKQIEAPGLDDFIGLENHEIMVRFFLFL